MATLLNPDGSTMEITPQDRAIGFSLEELYMLLDCETVQRLRLGGDPERFMLVDEDAKLRKQPWQLNLKATSLFHQAGFARYDRVIGKALIVTEEEFK